MKILRLMLLLAVSLPLAHGQQCAISFNLAAAGSSNAFNNLTRGCVNWTVTFNSTGFSALTFTVETAPNNAGVPGAWSTFTAASGSNPSTAITQASATFAGYFPFVRVTLSGLTGTGAVSGLLYGSATDYGGGGGGGTVTAVGPDAPGTPSTANPVQVAGNDGTDVRAIRTDTSGNTQVTGPAANGAAAVDRPLIIGGIRAGAATARSITTILTGAQEALAVAAGINTSNGHQPIAVDFSGGVKLSVQGTALADGFSNTVGLTADSATNGLRHNTFGMVFNGTTWDRRRGNTSGAFAQGPVASGAALAGNPIRVGLSDGTNVQNWLTASALTDTDSGLNAGAVALSVFDSSLNEWARARGSVLSGLRVGGVGSSAFPYPFTACDAQESVVVTAGNTLEIYAPTAGNLVRICSFVLSGSIAGRALIVQGTGTNCGTGTATMLDTYVPASGAVPLGSGVGEVLRGAASNSICVQAVTADVRGYINFAEFAP